MGLQKVSTPRGDVIVDEHLHWAWALSGLFHSGFPEDDRLEYALMEATKIHDNIQRQLNAESRATELLSRAVQQMEVCQKNMNVALSYSQYGEPCSAIRRQHEFSFFGLRRSLGWWNASHPTS